VDYQIHYMFDDDIDYLGAKLIATNSSLAYWMIDDATASAYPALLRNNARLALYDKLRAKNYFSDSVKEKLGKLGSEWELIEIDGKYGFREKLYQKSVIVSEESNRISGNNAFGASAPSLIRIEGLYTSKNGGKEVLLADLDENKSLDEQIIQFNYTSPLNLTETAALKVRIFGDGSGDYISIQLKSSPETIPGTVDHVIKLDFTGWREITLAEAMTGIYDGTVWSESGLTYVHEYRELCAHHAVVYMNVRRIGDCSNVRIDWIKAVEYENNLIVNPSVTINGSKITFQCSLDSTSFIELKGVVAMLYSSKGNSKQINFSGTLPVIDGEYTGEFTCDSSSGSPRRAYVTVGFDGEELFEN